LIPFLKLPLPRTSLVEGQNLELPAQRYAVCVSY